MDNAPKHPQPLDYLIYAGVLFFWGFFGLMDLGKELNRPTFDWRSVSMTFILWGAALLFVLAFLRQRRQLQREGWWEPIEAAFLQLPLDDGQFPEGHLRVTTECIEQMMRFRSGLELVRADFEHITAIGVTRSGRCLYVAYRQPPPNPYSKFHAAPVSTEFVWKHYSKAERIALLRELRRVLPHVRFSGFAQKLMDGYYPRAVS